MRDIRRLRLKEWFADRTLPEREKSYLSQLINGKSSFGEKAARRIESDYGIPHGHLDQPPTDPDAAISEAAISLDEQESKLIELFRCLPDTEKEHMVTLFNEKVIYYNKMFEELLQRRNTIPKS